MLYDEKDLGFQKFWAGWRSAGRRGELCVQHLLKTWRKNPVNFPIIQVHRSTSLVQHLPRDGKASACGPCRLAFDLLHHLRHADRNAVGGMSGREQAGLSASDRFQTGFRPVSDRCQTSAMPGAQSMSQCHAGSMHSSFHRVMSDLRSHVGCTEVPCRIATVSFPDMHKS